MGRLSKEEILRGKAVEIGGWQIQAEGGATNALEDLLYTLKKKIKDEKIGSQLAAADKKKIEDAMEETIQWLDNNQLITGEHFFDECNAYLSCLKDAPETISNPLENNDACTSSPQLRRSSSRSSARMMVKLAALGVVHAVGGLTGIILNGLEDLFD